MAEARETRAKALRGEVGIYYSLPFEDYIQIPAVNNSVLKIIPDKSCRHARWYKQHGKESRELTFGRLTHTLLLEPEKVIEEYRVHEDIHRGTKAWKAFEQESLDAGFQPIQQSDYDKAKTIVAMIFEQPVHRFIRKGSAEVTLVWDDEKTGLLCKARVDYLHQDVDLGNGISGDFLVDIKTANDVSPEGFSKACYNLRYFQQAAMSTEGWEVLTGHTPAFVFLAIEKAEPYVAVAYETQGRTLDAGLLAYRDALKQYAQCLKEDRWPGYATEVMPLDIPDWALKKMGINEYNMGAML